MSAGQGNTIEASDYNTIQQLIYGVIASKYGNSLQTVSTNGGTGTVSYGGSNNPINVIRYEQWNALQNDITALNYHLLGTTPVYNGSPLTTATTTTKISNADRAAYLAVAQGLSSSTSTTVGGVTYPGYYSIPASSQRTLTTMTSSSRTGIPSKSVVTHTVTLNFGTLANAQYYFYAGATVQFSASYTGGGSTLDSDWTTLVNGIGTVTFGLNGTTTTGTGTAAGSIGFNQLTGSAQQIYVRTIGVPTYANDQYQITASISGAVITFLINFNNNYTSTGDPINPLNFAVDGTITSTVQSTYSTGSYVSSSAYYPTVGSSGP
jgi:hypothetical protein